MPYMHMPCIKQGYFSYNPLTYLPRYLGICIFCNEPGQFPIYLAILSLLVFTKEGRIPPLLYLFVFQRMAAPIVTGVSPKDGPPGTRVTVRGENFGSSAADLIGLTICDCDCTLSAEWKTPNKIIARSGPGKGLGDVIVTTRHGGQGTCTVKFRGYTETIGPTKESAVWVDTPATLSWARRSLSPTSSQQEDPLGLSVEASETVVPEDDLNELFPGRCGDLGSDQFSAGWFLLDHHHSTNFDDLKAGLSHMKRNIDNQKRGELSFLKANVSSVLDQLDTLYKLQEAYKKDAQSFPDFTSRALRRIEETKEEAHQLFENVLARRERADTTRNGLAVLQRFKFLFCLPAVIEQNVLKGDFDVIINDYARVKHLFGNTKVAIFQKVLDEIETRIEGVRATLLRKLEDVQWSAVGSVDDYIKIIRNLLYLDAQGDVAWVGIESFVHHLDQSMHELKDKYIILETTKHAKRGKGGQKMQLDGKPHRVLFVEELVDLMEMCFPDLWKLGQAYFGGEFHVEMDPANPGKFKLIVLSSITTFCNLLRAAILPHSLNRSSTSRQMYGVWSNTESVVLLWLPHCLRYFRACYSCFIRIDLPSDALDIFSKLIFDLRLFIVTSLFRQAVDDINSFPKEENWAIEVHDKYGGITQLPARFDELMRKVVTTAHETVMVCEMREMQLMESAVAKKETLAALQGLFVAFGGVLEILAFVTEEGERSAVISQLIGTSDIPKPQHGSHVTWEQRLLAVLCNSEYTAGAIVPELWQVIQSCGFPASTEAITSAKHVFSTLNQKILDQYHEHKCDPLVGTIEPSMYLPKFDWDTAITPTDIRPYAKEIIMNLIGVRAELYRVPQITVRRIMCKIVETIAEELARLVTCVKRFSTEGSIQASADIMAVKDASKAYSTTKSLKFFKEALEGIPRVSRENEAVLKAVLSNFHARMALQLICLNDA